jgi:hypothetical protein
VTVAAAAMPVVVVLSPRLFVTYSATVQAAYYAAGLLAYAGLVAATLWAARTGARRVHRLVAGASAGLLALLVVGRQAYAPEIGLAGALLVALATGLAAYLVVAAPAPGAAPRASGQSGD